MIENLQINGLRVNEGDDLYKYVHKKIGRLDLYMSKHSRQSVRADVRLKANKTKHGKKATCEVNLYMPKEILASKETTMNMFAAVDIVEQKLKNQLKRYKEKHEQPYKLHRRLIKRVKSWKTAY